jgi:hypothetical protein
VHVLAFEQTAQRADWILLMAGGLGDPAGLGSLQVGQDGNGESVLAGEVEPDQAFRNACVGCHLFEQGAAVAEPSEVPGGYFEDGLAGR